MGSKTQLLTTYTVSFDSKGGLSVTSQQVAKNGFANKPNNPTYAGHTFKHWMLNNVAFVFETTPITASITLEALLGG